MKIFKTNRRLFKKSITSLLLSLSLFYLSSATGFDNKCREGFSPSLNYEGASLVVQKLFSQNPQEFQNLKEQEQPQQLTPLEIKALFRKLKNNNDPRLKQVPRKPNIAYKHKGWTNWSDFLGTEKPNLVGYKEASQIVQSLSIKSIDEFQKLRKTNLELQKIPSNPYSSYKEEWTSSYDFFGKEKSNFVGYKEASRIVQSLSIKSIDDFRYLRNHIPELQKIPANLQSYYKEWTNTYDFFGKEKPNFVGYKEASQIVQSLSIKSMAEFQKLRNQIPLLKKIPSNPQIYYKEWTSTYDFFGTEDPSNKFADHEEASQIVQNLSIKKMSEFRKLKKQKDPRLKRLPEFPATYYKGRGWINEYNFFGTEEIIFVDYEEASRIVQSLAIKSIREFNELKEQKDPRLKQIPANPKRHYVSKGLIDWDWDWDHFFGKEKPAHTRI